MEIYKRIYDNNTNTDGSIKENALLGDFEILENVFEDAYDSLKIGKRVDDRSYDIYLIDEREVKGLNGGSRIDVYKLTSVTTI